jgi:multidrug efflux system membrane fusion protein
MTRVTLAPVPVTIPPPRSTILPLHQEVHMKRIQIVAASIAALATLSGGALYLRSSSAETKPAIQQPQALPVPVAVIEEQEVTTWDEFSGRLEAVERVDVRSRVAGAVQAVHFTEGALVRKGDLLVTIDPAPYAATTCACARSASAA